MWKFLPSTDAHPDAGALPETTRCAIIPPETDPETVVNFLFVASGGKAIVCKTVESQGPFKKVDDLYLHIVTLADCPPGSWIFAEVKPGVWTEAIVAGLVEPEVVHSSFGLDRPESAWTWAQSQGHPMTHGNWGRPAPLGPTTPEPEKVSCPHCQKIPAPSRARPSVDLG